MFNKNKQSTQSMPLAPLSNGTKTFLSFLLILVIASLALNAFLLWQWMGFLQQAQVAGQQAQVMLAKTVADLGEFENSAIQFSVPIDETIPVKMMVKYKRNIEVPIKLTIPIDQNINTEIPLEINGITIPIKVSVPVKMNVPIDTKQNVPLDLEIPIDTEVPIIMDIPVNFKLSETGMSVYITQLREMLDTLNKNLAGQLP